MLKKVTKFTSFLVIILLLGCQNPFAAKTEKVPRNIEKPLEVEVFEIGKDRATLEIATTGTVEASNSANITPEIAGQISKIHLKVGENTRKNNTLISLDNSLNIDINELNLKTTQQGQKLAEITQNLSTANRQNNLEIAELQIKTAYDNYQATIELIDNTEDALDSQINIGEIELENAEEAYDNAQEQYEDGKDTLEEAEEDYENFDQENNPELKKQLKKNLEAAESQVDDLKFAKKLAKNRLEQAEASLENLNSTAEAQKGQLNSAKETAYNQYLATVEQYEGTDIASQLQIIQSESQLLQTNNQLESTKLALNRKNIKSPIEGIISEIFVEEGDFVAPGQVLMTINNDKLLSVKTALTFEERKWLTSNNQVTVEINGEEIQSYINSIGPTPNEISKKFDVEILIQNEKIQQDSSAKIKFKIKAINSIFIPLKSINIDDKKNFVYIVDSQNKIEIAEIEIGSILGEYVEIKSGITERKKIIIPETALLELGKKVEIQADPIKR